MANQSDLHHLHWERQGRSYEQVHRSFQGRERAFFHAQEQAILEYLGGLEFETVLEFGCGFGRISRLILDTFAPKTYHAFDLSDDQVIATRKLCPEVWTVPSTIQDYDPPQTYDLVFGVEVLLHVPPAEIEAVFDRIAGWTRRHLVHVDQWPVQPGVAYKLLPTASGLWSGNRCDYSYYHNYPVLHEMAKRECVRAVTLGDRQGLFHWNRLAGKGF